MCKFTQIMCKLHKSWSTRGHVDQGSQLHKSPLHKSQNQLKQPLWIHHPLASFRFFECVEIQVGESNRQKFRQAILFNGVTIARGNSKCYLLCEFFGAYTTHQHNLCKAWEDMGHFWDLCKSVFGYAPMVYGRVFYLKIVCNILRIFLLCTQYEIAKL